jgi:hypothetical protein
MQDYVEILGDALDEAAGNLEEHEIEPLGAAIRNKIGAILSEQRRRRPERSAKESERDPNDRWWD